MDQRRITNLVAESVNDALATSRKPIASLAQATDTTVPQMESKLSGAEDFTFSELVAVGGFFCVQPHTFLEGAQA